MSPCADTKLSGWSWLGFKSRERRGGKGHKSRNVLVVVGTNVPGKGWALSVAVGSLETQTGTSPEGQRPVSPWGGIKGSQNAYGAQGQEELLWHRPDWVALQFLLPTADVTSAWDMAAVVPPLALPPSWAQASQQF